MKRWVYVTVIMSALIFALLLVPKDFTGVIGPTEIIGRDIKEVTLSSGWPAIVFMAAIIAAFFLLNHKKTRKKR